MGARNFWFFLQENLHAHQVPRFGLSVSRWAPFVDPETLQRVRANLFGGFSVNFASESACLVPVEHQEPARAVAQTNCNA